MVSVILKINQLNNKINDGNNNNSKQQCNLNLNVWDDFDSKLYDPISFIYAEIINQLASDGDKSDNIEMVGVFYNPQGLRPAISIIDYLKRLVTFLGCSHSCFIISLVYIDRMLKTKRHSLNSYNVHRFIFGCILVSIKFYDDYFYPTNVYAKVGGVSVQETIEIERKILEELEFDIVVREDEYNHYLGGIDGRGYIALDIMNQQEEPDESDTESEDTASMTTEESEDYYVTKSTASSSSLASSTKSLIISNDIIVNDKLRDLEISTIDILSKSSGIDIPRGPLVNGRSRSLSNSYDVPIFKNKGPQLFISPSLKHRYRRNSYNQRLLSATPSGSNEITQSH